MPDLFFMKTSDFELSVWSKNIEASQGRLAATKRICAKALPPSVLRFSPPVILTGSVGPQGDVKAGESLFFENKIYDLEFVFSSELKKQFITRQPRVLHWLQTVEDAFRYNPKTGSLRASLNTGNDVGLFSIELEYWREGNLFRQAVSYDVLPTKMDMDTNIKFINKDIDDNYPLWRFSLAERTKQNLRSERGISHNFLLLWLADRKSVV